MQCINCKGKGYKEVYDLYFHEFIDCETCNGTGEIMIEGEGQKINEISEEERSTAIESGKQVIINQYGQIMSMFRTKEEMQAFLDMGVESFNLAATELQEMVDNYE